MKMGRYSVKCPVPGCMKVMTVDAPDWESAYKKVFPIGAKPVVDEHPDFPEPEDRDIKAREYLEKELKEI